MVNKNLAGRCGLYCGYCSIYRAYKDSEKFRKEIAEMHNCRPEEVKCEGCQAIDVGGWSKEDRWGKNCKILKCANARKVKFCYECPGFATCQNFDEFAKMNLDLGIDVRRNLQMIKEGEVEEWLLEQDKKWRCSKCGKPMAVSTIVKNCHWCGHQLRK